MDLTFFRKTLHLQHAPTAFTALRVARAASLSGPRLPGDGKTSFVNEDEPNSSSTGLAP